MPCLIEGARIHLDKFMPFRYTAITIRRPPTVASVSLVRPPMPEDLPVRKRRWTTYRGSSSSTWTCNADGWTG